MSKFFKRAKFYYDTAVDQFKFTHAISDHLVTIEEIKDQIINYDRLKPVLDKIEPWATEITSWNAEARYNFDFVKTINAIETTMKLAKELSDFTSKLQN